MSPSLHGLRTFLSQGRKALVPPGEAVSRIPLFDMLAHNWYLGFTSFGGPTVHFQIFRDLFVEKYQWLPHNSFDEIFGLSQALSGPASTKMLYVINVMHYSLPVGIVSFFVWSLPMALASFGLASGVGRIGEELPGLVYALLSGLNSATVGIVALAAVQLSGKAITDTLTRCLVFLGACAGMLYNALWYFPVLIVVGGSVAIVHDLKWLQRGRRKVFARRKGSEPAADGGAEVQEIGRPASQAGSAQSYRASRQRLRTAETETSSTTDPQSSRTSIWSWQMGLAIILGFFAFFLIVMICRGLYSGENRGFDLFANLYLAGTIIFGGGPVVIPLLREYTVTPGWVSSRDFLLGLAITQAFPGPNFNFAVYLGTLAVQATAIPPVVGAFIAYLAIFAPGLWLATGASGLWSSVRKVHAVRACLRGIHATAVGLVFTAVYRLFEIGYLDAEVRNGGSLGRDPWWVVIVATSFVGGKYFGLNPPMAILLGCVMGLIWYGVITA